jgi:hypothetical protein
MNEVVLALSSLRLLNSLPASHFLRFLLHSTTLILPAVRGLCPRYRYSCLHFMGLIYARALALLINMSPVSN